MIFKRIFKPKINKVVSVDFGQHSQKIVYADSRNNYLLAYDVLNLAFCEENFAKITEFIENFIKTKHINTRNAYLSISDPAHIVIRNLSLPQLPKNEIFKAIKWQLKDELNFECDDTLSGWRQVKEFDEDEVRKEHVIFYCLKDIEKYLDVITKSDLLPLGLTCGVFNYSSLLAGYADKPNTQAILDIGPNDSTLCIYKQNNPTFVRRLAFSTEKITLSLTDTLVTTRGAIKLSYEKAQEIRNNFGVIQDETNTIENDIPAVHIISLMRPLLELLARELKYSMDYYVSNFKEDAPAVLYITGGGANLKNLDNFLSKELNMKVTGLYFPLSCRISGEGTEEFKKEKNQLINAYAATLSSPESFSLVPPEVKIKRFEPVEKSFLRFTALTAGLFLAVSYYFMSLQLNFYNKKLADNKNFLEQLSDVRDASEKIRPLEEVVYEINSHRVPAAGLLKLLSRVMPANVILEELSLDQQSNTMVLKGEIIGKNNFQESSISKLIQSLNSSIFLKKAILTSLKDKGDSGVFEISGELVY